MSGSTSRRWLYYDPSGNSDDDSSNGVGSPRNARPQIIRPRRRDSHSRSPRRNSIDSDSSYRSSSSEDEPTPEPEPDYPPPWQEMDLDIPPNDGRDRFFPINIPDDSYSDAPNDEMESGDMQWETFNSDENPYVRRAHNAKHAEMMRQGVAKGSFNDFIEWSVANRLDDEERNMCYWEFFVPEHFTISTEYDVILEQPFIDRMKGMIFRPIPPNMTQLKEINHFMESAMRLIYIVLRFVITNELLGNLSVSWAIPDEDTFEFHEQGRRDVKIDVLDVDLTLHQVPDNESQHTPEEIRRWQEVAMPQYEIRRANVLRNSLPSLFALATDIDEARHEMEDEGREGFMNAMSRYGFKFDFKTDSPNTTPITIETKQLGLEMQIVGLHNVRDLIWHGNQAKLTAHKKVYKKPMISVNVLRSASLLYSKVSGLANDNHHAMRVTMTPSGLNSKKFADYLMLSDGGGDALTHAITTLKNWAAREASDLDTADGMTKFQQWNLDAPYLIYGTPKERRDSRFRDNVVRNVVLFSIINSKMTVKEIFRIVILLTLSELPNEFMTDGAVPGINQRGQRALWKFYRVLNGDKPVVPRPLSPDEMRRVKRSLAEPAISVVATVGKTIISAGDLALLRPGGWLNDKIIDAAMYLLHQRWIQHPEFPRCAFFDSKFYDVLTHGRRDFDYGAIERIKLTTGEYQIFESIEKIIIPIFNQNQWSIAVVTLRDSRISFYDAEGYYDSECANVSFHMP